MQELEAMLEQQDGSCAICKTHWTKCPSAKRTRYEKMFLQHLYVDHDHASGAVRGLLCNNCNTGIALFAEEPARLRDAINYVIRHHPEKGHSV